MPRAPPEVIIDKPAPLMSSCSAHSRQIRSGCDSVSAVAANDARQCSRSSTMPPESSRDGGDAHTGRDLSGWGRRHRRLWQLSRAVASKVRTDTQVTAVSHRGGPGSDRAGRSRSRIARQATMSAVTAPKPECDEPAVSRLKREMMTL
jgi:hypothetical protein